MYRSTHAAPDVALPRIFKLPALVRELAALAAQHPGTDNNIDVCHRLDGCHLQSSLGKIHAPRTPARPSAAKWLTSRQHGEAWSGGPRHAAGRQALGGSG